MTSDVRSSVDLRNQRLLTWYTTHRRDLPWRTSTDPYRVLVSEIMLQQTQVDRVITRFRSFIARWPTADDLADATADEVLSEWSGLGYNSRALRLKEAASVVSDRGWPTTAEGLLTLPGVGPYTAAAVASICFGQQVPAVDTNLRRVLSRWHGEALDGRGLREYANSIVGSPAGDWNQALMDLGSMVCRPRDPSCARCPVAESCEDPAIYVPPPRQSRFHGSNRQLRGALVRASLEGRDLTEAGMELGRSQDQINETTAALVDEGLIPAD